MWNTIRKWEMSVWQHKIYKRKYDLAQCWNPFWGRISIFLHLHRYDKYEPLKIDRKGYVGKKIRHKKKITIRLQKGFQHTMSYKSYYDNFDF